MDAQRRCSLKSRARSGQLGAKVDASAQFQARGRWQALPHEQRLHKRARLEPSAMHWFGDNMKDDGTTSSGCRKPMGREHCVSAPRRLTRCLFRDRPYCAELCELDPSRRPTTKRRQKAGSVCRGIVDVSCEVERKKVERLVCGPRQPGNQVPADIVENRTNGSCLHAWAGLGSGDQ